MSKKEARLREVPAVRKAVAILDLLSREQEPISLNIISKKLDQIPSTSLHILRVLVSEGLVSVDTSTKRYDLDVGILSLARRLLKRNEHIRLLKPELDRLAVQYNVTLIAVKIIDIQHSVVISLSHSRSTMRLNVEIGSRFPTLVSATGRCYAAFGGQPSDILLEHFHKLRWSKPPSLADWEQQVAETKGNGYAIDVGNYIAGQMIISAPLIEQGIMRYGIAAVGEVDLVNESKSDLARAILATIKNVESL
jgi:DNA-binding IclR family transcriptional regulator